MSDASGHADITLLDGQWDFAYEPDNYWDRVPANDPAQDWDRTPRPPAEFAAVMPIPGFWDDHLAGLRYSPYWSLTQFNPVRPMAFPCDLQSTPDASLPYLKGIGWHRKRLELDEAETSRLVTLRVGGVSLEAWVWVNGNFAGRHVGYSTFFEMPLDKFLKPGPNEIVIGVANTRTNLLESSATRGYAGRSGGIYRSVSLLSARRIRIRSLYVYPTPGNRELAWNLETAGRDDSAPDAAFSVDWLVRDRDTGAALAAGSVKGNGASTTWSTGNCGLRAWSDRQPVLYEISATVRLDGEVCDSVSQAFGLRRLERDGFTLKLNGIPVYLRGHCEMHYFPAICTAPTTAAEYRAMIRQIKKTGFNLIRFHTWFPSEEYMQAADELGMMMKVEVQRQASEEEWTWALRAGRRHPAVVIYCTWNEDHLDDRMIEYLRRLAALQRRHAPDALFDPQEALRGIEAGDDQLLGEPVEHEPFPHNPRRLKMLTEFSDVLSSYTSGGLVSYNSADGDWRKLERFCAIYERPLLSHEMGIHDSYLDLGLEQRYLGTRTGPQLYTAARRYLAENGLLAKAPLYYRNSCELMRRLRKHALETARMCEKIVGYNFLGAVDQHWHRSGYPCGIMNEFYEMKPGETEADVRRYNHDSVLLLDHRNIWSFFAGDEYAADLYVSLYGRSGLDQGEARWQVTDDTGALIAQGRLEAAQVRNGGISKIGAIRFAMPEVNLPGMSDGSVRQGHKLILSVNLQGGEYRLENEWELWCFPRPAKVASFDAEGDENVMNALAGIFPGLQPSGGSRAAAVRVVSRLDRETVVFLAAGGSVVLLGVHPFPGRQTRFLCSSTGRATNDPATVIADHPLMDGFPHDGFCNWQFKRMLDNACSVQFNNLEMPFDPILEVVSSYKHVRKQATVFEYRVGQGRMLVCSLVLNMDDPAAVHFAERLLNYVTGSRFRPRHAVTPDALFHLVANPAKIAPVYATDMAFDPNTLPVSERISGKPQTTR